MSDQDESRDMPTIHAPPFDDDEESPDDIDEEDVLSPFEPSPGAPEYFNHRAEIDHKERNVVLGALRRQDRMLRLTLRLFDANQKSEQAFKVATEARFGLQAAENTKTNARVEILREELRGARRSIKHLRARLDAMTDDGK
jgi:hypothetical protein